jgi:hypothetical protein
MNHSWFSYRFDNGYIKLCNKTLPVQRFLSPLKTLAFKFQLLSRVEDFKTCDTVLILDFRRGMNTDFWFWEILQDVQDKFHDDVSEAAVGPNLNGH